MVQKKQRVLHNPSHITSLKTKRRILPALLASVLSLSVLTTISIPAALAQTTERENTQYEPQIIQTERPYNVQDKDTESTQTQQRYGIKDQYEISLLMAQEIFANAISSGNRVDSIVLVSDADPLHPLTANRFANFLNAPVVIIPPQGLTPDIKELLSSNQIVSVYVVGGKNFLSDNVLEEIRSVDTTHSVTRVAAFNSASQISVNLAERSNAPKAWCATASNSSKAVFIVGQDAPIDAAIVVGQSVAYDVPILVSTSEVLSPVVAAYITENSITTAIIIGSTEVISKEVEESLKSLEIESVIRFGGEDRYETAIKVLEAFEECSDTKLEIGQNIILVNGRDFSAILSASSTLANGINRSGWTPLVITERDELPESLHWRLQQEEKGCYNIVPFGNREELPQGIVTAAESLTDRCADASSNEIKPPLIPFIPSNKDSSKSENNVNPDATFKTDDDLISREGSDDSPEIQPVKEVILPPLLAIPPEIVGQTAIVDFNEEDTTFVGTYYRTGLAVPSGISTWSLSGPDAQVFAFMLTSGNIKGDLMFMELPNYEKPVDANRDNIYEVILKVTDKTVPSVSGSLYIDIAIANVDEIGVIELDMPEEMPQVGVDIIAKLSDVDDIVGDTNWQWEKSSDTTNYTPISGATSSVYVPTMDVVSSMLRATASYFDTEGVITTATSEASEFVPITTPNAPVLTVNTEGTPESVELIWVAPLNDGGALIERYEYNISETPNDFSQDNWIQIINNNPLATSVILNNLVGGTVYYFVVRAVNEIGTGVVSNEVSITTISHTRETRLVGNLNMVFQEGELGRGTVHYLRYIPIDTSSQINWSLISSGITPSDAQNANLGIYSGPHNGPFTTDVYLADVILPDFEKPLDEDGDNIYNIGIVVGESRNGVRTNHIYEITIIIENIDEPGNIVINSAEAPSVGSELFTNLTDIDGGIRDLKWQWQRKTPLEGDNFSIENIPNATNSTYIPIGTDLGTFLIATVEYTDNQGTGKTESVTTSSIIIEGDAVLDIPRNLTSSGNNNQITLTWVLSDTYNLNTYYEYRQSTLGYDISTKEWVPILLDDIDIVQEGEPQISTTIYPLENGVEYFFQVRAKNTRFVSNPSARTSTRPVRNMLLAIKGHEELFHNEALDDISLPVATFAVGTDLTNSANENYIWSLSGGDSESFTISNPGGTVVFTNPPDFEAPASLNGDNTYTFSVNVIDTNYPLLSASPYETIVYVNNLDESGHIGISYELENSTPQIGEKITAVLSDPDGGVNNLEWRWNRRIVYGEENIEEYINGATENTYTPTANDAGYSLIVEAFYNDNQGISKEAVLSFNDVLLANPPNAPTNLMSIGGNNQVELAWINTNEADNIRYEYRQGITELELLTSTTWIAIASDILNISQTDISQITAVIALPENSVEYFFQVRALDDFFASVPSNQTSIATRANTPPTITGENRINYYEIRYGVGKSVTTLTAVDDNTNSEDIIWSLENGFDNDKFTISSSNGIINFKNPPDFETPDSINNTNTYMIQVAAQDDDISPQSSTFDILVNVWNVWESGLVTLTSEEEHLPFIDIEITTSLMDPDGGVRNSLWEWQSSSDGVTYVPIVGAINSTYIPTDDLLDNTLRAVVYYNDNSTTVGQVAVSAPTPPIVPYNEPPVIIGETSLSIIENDVLMAQYLAEDDLTPLENITLSLTGEDSKSFTLINGALSFATTPDFENPVDTNKDNVYNLSILAFDNKELRAGQFEHQIQVIVNNKDEEGMVFLSRITLYTGLKIAATLIDPDGNPSDPNTPPTSIIWQWESSDDNGLTWMLIPDANTEDFMPTFSNLGQLVRAVAVDYVDSEGTGKSATSHNTLIPIQSNFLEAPRELLAIGGYRKIELSWREPPGAVRIIRRYEYRQRLASDVFTEDWKPIAELGVDDTAKNITVPELYHATEYFFQIRAVTGIATTPINGPPSNETSAITSLKIRTEVLDIQVEENHSINIPFVSLKTSNSNQYLIADEDFNNFIVSDTGDLSFRLSPDYEFPHDKDYDNIFVISLYVIDNNKNVSGVKYEITIEIINIDEPS